jgi:hypothetical protein
MIGLYVLSAWLAADVATGIVHWWEDRYGAGAARRGAEHPAPL